MEEEVDEYGEPIEEGDAVFENFVNDEGELDLFVYIAGTVSQEELEQKRKERDEKFPDIP